MKRRLIVFDVEGVIIPGRRYMLFEVARRVGFLGFVKVLIIGILYEIGLINIETTIKRLFRILRGLTTDELASLYKRIPLMPDVPEVFKLIKNRFKVALISSGIPRFLVEDLAKLLGADYAVGPDLIIENGRLTGEVYGVVIKPNGKAMVLRSILKAEGLSPKDCIVVADDRNNLPMFRLCSLRIGYNPDFLVGLRSDVIVKGGLSGILPIIMDGMKETSPLDQMRTNLFREAIHISGAIIPIISIHLINPNIISLIITITTIIYAISETMRMTNRSSIPIISQITRRAADKAEFKGFVISPIFFAAGIIISLTLFPTPINYASIMVLTLGDGSASILGQLLGSRPLPFNKAKSLEGTIFGFISALIGSLLFLNPIGAIIAAAAGMIAESLPSPIDDNILIPIASGLALLASNKIAQISGGLII